MDVSAITERQLEAISVVERVGSVFSLLGCVFTIGTFCASTAFHKPINRLVFYASFGNLMTNVATLMARSYVGDTSSAGCQFQAFLIQMFMPADACWTLAMAVNVYLTFYFKFDAHRLRRMELPYLLVCYGLPFVVALAFLFVRTADQGHMYGNATLWCWVSSTWDIFRIALFYGPVWIVILVTFFIYFRAGREIYKKHKQLRDFSSHHEPEPLPPMDHLFCSSKTTEVHVTSEVVGKNDVDPAPLDRRGSTAAAAAAEQPQPPSAAYSVTISASARQPKRESFHDMTLPMQSDVATAQPSHAARHDQDQDQDQHQHPHQHQPAPSNPVRRRAVYEANNAAWSYAKCAILFFTALLVTWIPSSANRVFSVVYPGHVSMPLEFMSAFVLPLQGFWNACIYVITSWNACKTLVADMVFRVGPHRPTVTKLASMRADGGGGGGGAKGPSGGHANFPRMSDDGYGSERASRHTTDKCPSEAGSDSLTELASSTCGGSGGENSPT